MAYDFAHGSGTEADPYQIWTQTDLEGIGDLDGEGQPNYFGNYFKQMADLSLVDYECDSLVMVNCSYDGDNHKVTGLEDLFFSQQIGGVVKNLVFISPSISKSSENYVGVIGSVVQYSGNPATLSNIVVLGATVSGKDYVGAIVGYAYMADISDCLALGVRANGSSYVGGLVGMIDDCELLRCVAHGEVEASAAYSHAGGLVGLMTDSSADICGADVDVTGEQYCGGFSGYGYDSEIDDCFALGDVIGSDYAGGFSGYLSESEAM